LLGFFLHSPVVSDFPDENGQHHEHATASQAGTHPRHIQHLDVLGEVEEEPYALRIKGQKKNMPPFKPIN